MTALDDFDNQFILVCVIIHPQLDNFDDQVLDISPQLDDFNNHYLDISVCLNSSTFG